MENSFKQKYLKYKRKYLQLKKMFGGSAKKIDIELGFTTFQTLGDCIKELIDESYKIYTEILSSRIPTTILCGGQSPSYYCLAMMNFKIYNPELVDIVILPHSKAGVKTSLIDSFQENRLYCQRLREKNIMLKDNIVIIDGVHSGVGILAFESAIKSCFSNIKNIKKYAINAAKGVSKIPVDKEIILPCEPKFSDTFPRLVIAYHPRDFNDSTKFITEFINLETNPIAEMIIDLAKNYPEIQVEDTDWFRLNNEITFEIQEQRRLREAELRETELREERLREEELREERLREQGGFFTPIVLDNPKRYQCPICKTITGTDAVLYPENVYLFFHNFDCPNRYKIPKEN